MKTSSWPPEFPPIPLTTPTTYSHQLSLSLHINYESSFLSHQFTNSPIISNPLPHFKERLRFILVLRDKSHSFLSTIHQALLNEKILKIITSHPQISESSFNFFTSSSNRPPNRRGRTISENEPFLTQFEI